MEAIKKEATRLATESKDMEGLVEAQKDEWGKMTEGAKRKAAEGWYQSSIAGCAGMGLASLAGGWMIAAPLFVSCNVISLIHANGQKESRLSDLDDEYEIGIIQMKQCMKQFREIEQKCVNLASGMQKNLIKLKAAKAKLITEQTLMVADMGWRKFILPQNRKVVAYLKKIVRDYGMDD